MVTVALQVNVKTKCRKIINVSMRDGFNANRTVQPSVHHTRLASVVSCDKVWINVEPDIVFAGW